MKEQKFYRCNVCGNLVGLLQEGGGVLTCCNQPMQLLKANDSDGAHEKHVPVLEQEGNQLTIKVGSAPHPMIPEHYIMWIFVQTEGVGRRFTLQPGEEAKVVLDVGTEKVCAVYAYCNLHGLWKANI